MQQNKCMICFLRLHLDTCKNSKAYDIEKRHKEEAAGTQNWKRTELMLLKMLPKVHRKVFKPRGWGGSIWAK